MCAELLYTHLYFLREARRSGLILKRNNITGVGKVEGLPIVDSNIVSSPRRIGDSVYLAVTVLAWPSRLTSLSGRAQAPESII